MNLKLFIGIAVITGAVIFGALSFIESNVEYMDFGKASASKKKVQVKGVWMNDKATHFDADAGKFSFYMRDDSGREERVILNGAKPNNSEIADMIVVKGRYEKREFHATEILTKCPSKYEAVGKTAPSAQGADSSRRIF